MTMSKPTIKIAGKEYKIKNIKPKQWRKFFEFDDKREELSMAELIDSHCKIIAGFFDDDVTAELLLDNADIADILKLYNDIRLYLMKYVVSKLETETKNAEGGNQE